MKKRIVCALMTVLLILGSGSALSAAADSQYIVFNQKTGVAKTGAINYSWMNEAPAGKRGHVLVKDDGFIFEDGTPVKFFGVVLGFAAATPTKEVAEAMAEDLASMGVNLARLHAIDCTYSGVLSYKSGQKTAIDPAMLDRMDYLVYCLKQKGIYVHLDTSAGRVLTEADGFSKEEVAAGSNGALRAARFIDPKIVALEHQFALDLLNHVNPYTKMSYAKDPVFAIIQYANESSITWFDSWDPDNVFTRKLNVMYNEWLVEKYRTRSALAAAWTDDKGKCALLINEDPTKGTVKNSTMGSWGEAFVRYTTDFSNKDCSPRHADFMNFLMDVQAKNFKDFYKKVRDTGFKSAINCSNQPERAVDLWINALGDVMEKNTYWNHPQDNYTVPATFHTYEMSATDPRAVHGGDNFKTHNVGVVNKCSVADKPLVVTEWNTTAPSDFKADCLVQMAAYGAFQGWDGFCVFNYTFDGGDSYFTLKGYTDYFAFCMDPATYAQLGQCAMLFRLGIVSEAENSIELVMTEEDVLAQNSDYYKAPQILSYISKFSYRFIDDTYNGDADLVIPSGNTASGDYTKAKHLLMYSENIYTDPYNKNVGRTQWLNKHIQSGSKKFEVGFDGLSFMLGKSAAVMNVSGNDQFAGGGFYSIGTGLDEVATEVMRKFGLLEGKEGYNEDDIITDTGEITYTYNQSFKLETERAVALAGRLKKGKTTEFGGVTINAQNDRISIQLTSMDGEKSLDKASKINIFAMGRSTSTGLTWENKTSSSAKLTNLGTGPILVEDIRGTLIIPTAATKCTVYGLNYKGERVKEIETAKVSNGIAIKLGGFVNYEVLMSDFATTPADSSKPTTSTPGSSEPTTSKPVNDEDPFGMNSSATTPDDDSSSTQDPASQGDEQAGGSNQSDDTVLWIVLVVLCGILLIGGEAFLVYYLKLRKKNAVAAPQEDAHEAPGEEE